MLKNEMPGSVLWLLCLASLVAAREVQTHTGEVPEVFVGSMGGKPPGSLSTTLKHGVLGAGIILGVVAFGMIMGNGVMFIQRQIVERNDKKKSI
jgi:hypothetical protein